MNYTPQERLVRLWKLVEQDPDCAACQTDLQEVRQLLEERTNGMSKDESQDYWELPTSIHIFFSRVLELTSREMRFPEEAERQDRKKAQAFACAFALFYRPVIADRTSISMVCIFLTLARPSSMSTSVKPPTWVQTMRLLLPSIRSFTAR